MRKTTVAEKLCVAVHRKKYRAAQWAGRRRASVVSTRAQDGGGPDSHRFLYATNRFIDDTARFSSIES